MADTHPDAIGGFVQAEMLGAMNRLLATGTQITDAGAANAIHELLAQLETANQAASATRASAADQCNVLSMQAAGSLGQAAVTGLSLAGQTVALRGLNAQADTVNDRLVQQKQLDNMASEEQAKPMQPAAAVAGGPVPVPTDRDLAVTARTDHLLGDGGRTQFKLTNPAQKQEFPEATTDKYYHADGAAGTAGLDRQALAKMRSTDVGGQNQLKEFRKSNGEAIKQTTEELSAVRSDINQRRTMFSEVVSMFNNGVQGGFTLGQKGYTTDKGFDDANQEIARAASSNAAAGLQAAQSVQSSGSKSIDDTAQSFRAAIQAAGSV